VPALLIGLAAGGVAGALNGTLVTRIRLPPFIVTLGTLNIFTAIGLIYTKDQAVQAPDLPRSCRGPARRSGRGRSRSPPVSSSCSACTCCSGSS